MMKQERLFKNIDYDNEIMTLSELKDLFKNDKDCMEINENNFDYYLNGCMFSNNGSLVEIETMHYIDTVNDRIVTIQEIYQDYTREYKQDYKSFNDFIVNCIDCNVLAEIPETGNKHNLTPLETIKYINNKYYMNFIGAWEIVIQLIDNDLFYDFTLEDINHITENYYLA